jgi:hypothetical protein
MAIDPDPDWDGTYVCVVSPADAHRRPLVVIEMWGCAEIRFGGPNDETIHGHLLHGKGLAGYGAYKVVNSAWIEEAIKVNSVHPHHSDGPFPSCIITRCCSTTRCLKRWPGASSPGWCRERWG